ncbi:MAG: putative Ni/Fe-hydrogenase 1 B-type cytochrome subunit [Thermoanaerobaculia bacterium]|nr:putative Ni/Fe-hydrogenase 1 B-type cytochrome subunit [Thermoanaerobaculia bacterium]
MSKAQIRRVYVWELPVRVYHWVNALCILVLVVTGYLIGRPVAIQTAREASFSYWFGTVRFIHFIAAFAFFFNFVFRVYWGFAGNRYARWHQFIPTKKSQWKEIVDVLKVDILQARAEPLESIGHNALAGFTYFLSFLAFVFQCLTGFGMYAAMSHAALPKLFKWIVPLMGGDFAVRQWHHAMMWFFILFSMVHVYLVFYHDYVEGRGVISSMAGGWKFIEKRGEVR